MNQREFDELLDELHEEGWYQHVNPIDRGVVIDTGCETCGPDADETAYAVGRAYGQRGTENYRYRVWCVCSNCDTVTEF